MRKSIYYVALTCLLWTFVSCSGKNESDKVVERVDLPDENVLLEDTLEVEEKEPEEEKAPAVPGETGPDLPTGELQLSHMRQSGDWDKYEAGILPQMTEDAPEYVRAILKSDGKRFIVVDKAKMKLFLYDKYGNVEKSYGIACAKNYGTKHKKGDSRTTEGCFKVKGVFDSREWLFTDDNGYTSPVKGQYGPRFIRLNIPYIGIHGTGSPRSIGKRVSHGCIRVTNENILDLVKYVEEGMTVIISPGPRDMAVNSKEGANILAVSTEPGGTKAKPGWDQPQTSTPREETVPAETENEPETEAAEPEENNAAPAAAAEPRKAPAAEGEVEIIETEHQD